ncbi:hypothetical protein [Halogeometricum luteum]|uniref:Uncharacterized protein n=1 Tax=Halogeometricum luteum TaxID=2950537 RepID=A0ABU2FYQ8_9EURY|nr:hypothetical protein [Halogeometricum sp. S3BR5-2]MDS0293669.1 hypothetical protein [Halogeometricum sp. S3BR5-2]
MAQIARLRLRADSTGTLELVCERSASERRVPDVRSFVGKGEFGLLVDGLDPNEPVTLFVERDSGARALPARTPVEAPTDEGRE